MQANFRRRRPITKMPSMMEWENVTTHNTRVMNKHNWGGIRWYGIDRTELGSWSQVESRGGKILVRINTRASRQASKRTRRRLSLAERRDTSRVRCRQQRRFADKSVTCDFGWSWSFNKIELRLTHLAELWIRLLLYPFTENFR